MILGENKTNTSLFFERFETFDCWPQTTWQWSSPWSFKARSPFVFNLDKKNSFEVPIVDLRGGIPGKCFGVTQHNLLFQIPQHHNVNFIFKPWSGTSLTWWQPDLCRWVSALGPECWCPARLGSFLSNSAPWEMNNDILKTRTQSQIITTDASFNCSNFSFWKHYFFFWVSFLCNSVIMKWQEEHCVVQLILLCVREKDLTNHWQFSHLVNVPVHSHL